MQLVADLHLHSKYSRAVSKQMILPVMAQAAKTKGIDLLATGDFTHPLWIRELDSQLEEVSSGIYKVKDDRKGAQYILGTEISCIYSQGGKGRRIHVLVFAPNLETVHKINQKMTSRGCNLASDGRPIIGLSIIDLCELLFSVDESIVVIPAHVWTPWFGLLGSASGFDSLRECCGKYADKIYAVETGLSSDPAMNWRIAEFNSRSIVSFSDAHSPAKLGRELTVLKGQGKTPFSYQQFVKALQKQGDWQIDYTVEFYPEEGKYHIDGHAKCGIRQTPTETRKKGRVCPVCGKNLTLGVLGRVDTVGTQEVSMSSKINEQGLKFYYPDNPNQKPYIMLVPLQEIIAESLGKGINTKGVAAVYEQLLAHFNNELTILTKTSLVELEKHIEPKIVEAISKVRQGDICVIPGYDGIFGTVRIWGDETMINASKEQLDLF